MPPRSVAKTNDGKTANLQARPQHQEQGLRIPNRRPIMVLTIPYMI